MSKATAQPQPARRPAVAAPSGPQPPTSHDIWTQVAVVFFVAVVARALHFWAMRSSVFFDVLVCDGRQCDFWARRLG